MQSVICPLTHLVKTHDPRTTARSLACRQCPWRFVFGSYWSTELKTVAQRRRRLPPSPSSSSSSSSPYRIKWQGYSFCIFCVACLCVCVYIADTPNRVVSFIFPQQVTGGWHIWSHEPHTFEETMLTPFSLRLINQNWNFILDHFLAGFTGYGMRLLCLSLNVADVHLYVFQVSRFRGRVTLCLNKKQKITFN